MKKAIFIVLFFVSASSMAWSYRYVPALSFHEATIIKNNSVVIPQPALDHFNSMFSGAKGVSWKVGTDQYGNTEYVAKFSMWGNKQTAAYLADGTYLGGGSY